MCHICTHCTHLHTLKSQCRTLIDYSPSKSALKVWGHVQYWSTCWFFSHTKHSLVLHMVTWIVQISTDLSFELLFWYCSENVENSVTFRVAMLLWTKDQIYFNFQVWIFDWSKVAILTSKSNNFPKKSLLERNREIFWYMQQWIQQLLPHIRLCLEVISLA